MGVCICAAYDVCEVRIWMVKVLRCDGVVVWMCMCVCVYVCEECDCVRV